MRLNSQKMHNIIVAFASLDVAKREIEALKTSVNTLEKEKRGHVQSKHVQLPIV